MITELASLDKVIGFQRRVLVESLTPEQIGLYHKIDNYLDQYVDFYKLDSQGVLDRHRMFVEQYSKDLSEFEKTGRYPYEINSSYTPVDRITYDIALIVSCLLVSHRFLIMYEISKYTECGENALFVGVGTGLEIALIEESLEKFDAYDLSISEFAKDKYKKGNLLEALFEGGKKKRYDTVFCIELLEHVENPYHLLSVLYDSLNPSGNLLATTAKDIPQFDHVVNFTNEFEFEDKISGIGFSIINNKLLKHNNLFSKVDSNNIFYHLKK
jgi:hypothetical protein